MTAINAQDFNSELIDCFNNGRGEVGLEVGNDPGLPADHYIQIPQCMVKQWCARIINWDAHYLADHPNTPVPPQYAAAAGDTIAVRGAGAGWVNSGRLIVHDGALWVASRVAGGYAPVMDFAIERPTLDDVRAFVTVNWDHINGANIPDEYHNWIHASRFWAVVGGLVRSTKNREFTVVANPGQIRAGIDDVCNYILNFSANGWTAAAARTASWRKTNHATGGETASGFPRRWMSKLGVWSGVNDPQTRQRQQRSATRAFYMATHAVSVHAVLALMIPADTHHWADLDPSSGLVTEWEVGASTTVRISPRNQVAGVAIVNDAFVVYGMLVKEGLSPLLSFGDQAQALVNAREHANREGMRVATYARWFFDGHPTGVGPDVFNQKDVSHAGITGELASVATRYYATSTIGQSMALSGAANTHPDEEAKNAWAALAANRRALSTVQIIAAVKALKGAASTGVAVGVTSQTEATCRQAVAGYNTILAAHAALVGITIPPSYDADQVWAAVHGAPAPAP